MFFQRLSDHGDSIAVIEADRQICYRQLQQMVEAFRARLPQARSLALLKAGNDLDSLVAYLACLQARHPMLLVERSLEPLLQSALIESYHPNLIISDSDIECCHAEPLALADELALLLSTSGSTGSPKQVALSADNLHANANAIVASLPIRPDDRAITTLPFPYSYGLSVINSHLRVGACIVLNAESPVSRGFWEQFRSCEVTSLAGVPFSYDMLLRLRLTQMDLPSLRYLTQAGGKLSPEKVRQLAQWAEDTGRRLFVMYGQTEATARMAVNDRPLEKPEAIGRPIPGGEFQLLDSQGERIFATRQEGELVYCGPNVMLGYARSLADLEGFSPDLWLRTGDLAWFDGDGDFYISGRLKRMIKPFGQRISLDDVQRLLSDQGIRAFAVGSDQVLQVVMEHAPPASQDLRGWLARTLGLHPSVISVRTAAALPVLPNGKPDYPAVERLFDE